MGFFQEVHAVLRRAKTTFESPAPNFEAVEALESYAHALYILIPDIDCTLTLLLIVVFGLAVDDNPGYLSILSKEFVFPQVAFLRVLPGDPDDVEEVWNDHPELLEAHQS